MTWEVWKAELSNADYNNVTQAMRSNFTPGGAYTKPGSAHTATTRAGTSRTGSRASSAGTAGTSVASPPPNLSIAEKAVPPLRVQVDTKY